MIRLPTTERVTPDSWALRVTFWQSLAAYRWACTQAHGKRVLDVGCGDGYGAAELASVARWVVGLDSDRSALRHAAQRYRTPNLSWVQATAERLPFRSGSIDVVCCFQVLEHLANPAHFLAEVRRVLAPGGLLLLTTPNREAVLSGLNPHHVREYDAESLRNLLASFFEHVEGLGVFPSARVRTYRETNRQAVERLLRLDRFGLHQRLPPELRARLHALGTLLVRRWINRHTRQLVESIGVADFAIGPGDLSHAIDLVGIARRREPAPNQEFPLDERVLQD
ncbi:class I SAM-dependent methyltransferase [Thermomicrobium sp. 4228-Ro]|uniref:class I SAM-dependent methyltransferase n=1 Tax=Thermomicrobium sp. 4228-Ro TaxID=2993937 RepID=UPI002248802E|nr:class I SAM-dependent methyltransferase [Thermomicrobium sp. 4228-Ro]MCX2726875.1 class I SAM-dependent methyltransferase [Thermomicrobium sp. 4228-Ro]